ncbi:HEPN domain-containing protein [Desulfonatronovibrio magnus]|uniref:HEPN domain-containing protein n=1 Tax=Desulfonatronovibrio magnus TaxID=698827 RepID=UPI0005EAFA33|nr:HEPN domain-containing protein [Desulfonatronovibrio magnus]
MANISEINNKVNFWIVSAEKDWVVAGHLLEKQDYPYSLFFAHLTLEKLLKAYFVSTKGKNPPLSHRLTYLAEKSEIELSIEQVELLEIVTDFNLEARYPDEKFSFHKKCSREFTINYLNKIEEMKSWLMQKMKSSKT